MTLQDRVELAISKDPDIVCKREELDNALGSNPEYLETLGLTKSDLIRLERQGKALKARYSTVNKTGRKFRYLDPENNQYESSVTGPHRTRWLIFKED